MRTVALVLDNVSSVRDFYTKADAKRYYASIDTRVFYFQSGSKYWMSVLKRLNTEGVQLIAATPMASARLSLNLIEHQNYDASQSVLENLKLFNNAFQL